MRLPASGSSRGLSPSYIIHTIIITILHIYDPINSLNIPHFKNICIMFYILIVTNKVKYLIKQIQFN